ncbi:ALG11 [Lepeophtheirus salmonis]|uniref:GDP-Man:Man(3)GlcNAc(2)-PP-Dol alpha-1,2-mannosyltransferase n=1 Tax=Lepeophtheirus salmonis TaxID=72036 RepID=A0A7R8H6D3_LEPSM|nr:ALG11 [Lepeophtheirus salmonis]CAF2899626.1 ALG11 [Lepeophtheirus salmonis]
MHRPGTVAFFHPYCDAGGGGERVLWAAILAIRKRYPAYKMIVYTGDVSSHPEAILKKAEKRFNLPLDFSISGDDPELTFVYLHRRTLVEASNYPVFTLLGQSLGSVLLALEALHSQSVGFPEIFIDTMGYAFTLPIFKYLVRLRRPGYNNSRYIAQNLWVSKAKTAYYKTFAYLYGLTGRFGSMVTMVNSSWTEEHIKSIWKTNVHRIYPPCDVEDFSNISIMPDSEKINKTILSVGQFRPEKDHALQIRSMFELRQILKEEEWQKVRLLIIGGCRNEEDEARVQDLKDLCKHLAVESNVEFKVNLPFHDLKKEMQKATIGIHTMWNEHFGIAVVEMLAAGLVTLAHRSGGPLMDIIIEDDNSRNGFLAVHDEEYASTIALILNSSDEFRDLIRERARSSVSRFSDEEFKISWLRAVAPLFISI